MFVYFCSAVQVGTHWRTRSQVFRYSGLKVSGSLTSIPGSTARALMLTKNTTVLISLNRQFHRRQCVLQFVFVKIALANCAAIRLLVHLIFCPCSQSITTSGDASSVPVDGVWEDFQSAAHRHKEDFDYLPNAYLLLRIECISRNLLFSNLSCK